MRDYDLKLEEVKASHTLGGNWRPKGGGRGGGVFLCLFCNFQPNEKRLGVFFVLFFLCPVILP